MATISKPNEKRIEFTVSEELELKLRKLALESDPPRRSLPQFLRDLAERAEPLGPSGVKEPRTAMEDLRADPA